MKKKNKTKFLEGKIEDIIILDSAMPARTWETFGLGGTSPMATTMSGMVSSLTVDAMQSAYNNLRTDNFHAIGIAPNYISTLRTSPYFATYMCDECQNPAFYVVKKIIEGAPATTDSILLLDGQIPSAGVRIDCGSCGAKIKQAKIDNLVVLRDDEKYANTQAYDPTNVTWSVNYEK